MGPPKARPIWVHQKLLIGWSLAWQPFSSFLLLKDPQVVFGINVPFPRRWTAMTLSHKLPSANNCYRGRQEIQDRPVTSKKSDLGWGGERFSRQNRELPKEKTLLPSFLASCFGSYCVSWMPEAMAALLQPWGKMWGLLKIFSWGRYSGRINKNLRSVVTVLGY